MHKILHTIVILWFLIVTAIPVRAYEYRLGPDDLLNITVYREEELDRTLRVSSDGTISFPLLNSITVEGLSVSDLEKKITLGLKKYIKHPQVTVFIEEYTTISVVGEVNKPGSYPLRGNLTVLEAIGLAEGFTKIAAKNRVKILRREKGNKKTITVNIKSISKGDHVQDIELKRGDIVYVPESFF